MIDLKIEFGQSFMFTFVIKKAIELKAGESVLVASADRKKTWTRACMKFPSEIP